MLLHVMLVLHHMSCYVLHVMCVLCYRFMLCATCHTCVGLQVYVMRYMLCLCYTHTALQVMVRCNFLVVMLCLVMNRPYMSYYFVPLISFWFTVTQLALAAYPRMPPLSSPNSTYSQSLRWYHFHSMFVFVHFSLVYYFFIFVHLYFFIIGLALSYSCLISMDDPLCHNLSWLWIRVLIVMDSCINSYGFVYWWLWIRVLMPLMIQ